jgi:phosphohistidine phosphatase
MKLYILRHGEAADHGDPRYENDADRPLTARGIRRTKQLAHTLRQLEIAFDVIFSSPLVRALETAEIVERGLRLHNRLEQTDHLAPTGDFDKLIAQVNEIRPRPEDVLLVGHEPYLSALISRLCTGGQGLALNLKKGGFCRLEVETLRAGRCATLEWLLSPRLLDSKRPKKR